MVILSIYLSDVWNIFVLCIFLVLFYSKSTVMLHLFCGRQNHHFEKPPIRCFKRSEFWILVRGEATIYTTTLSSSKSNVWNAVIILIQRTLLCYVFKQFSNRIHAMFYEMREVGKSTVTNTSHYISMTSHNTTQEDDSRYLCTKYKTT